MQLGVLERDHGPEAVVATGQLHHDQDLVVGDAFLLGRVDRPREGVGDRGVPRRQAGRAGAEDESRLQEVAPLELVDAVLFSHSLSHLLELEFR